MLCRQPFIRSGAAFGCGQCLPCRIKRRRIWVHRLLLEGLLHAESSFVTVTYSEECVPRIEGVPTLRRKDYRDWLKRLRSRMAEIVPGWKLRFFLVGEYGDKEERPHYHAALFGYKGCEFGDWFVYSGQRRKECKCDSCGFIRASWGMGRIHQGVIERKSAQYLAGYTVKGMTGDGDRRLRGREPEFARMSLRPGLGADAVSNVIAALSNSGLAEGRDAPAALRHGAKVLPIGRYLRERLRLRLGVSDALKARSLEEWKEELRELREAAAALSDKSVYLEGTYNEEIFRRLLVEQDVEKVRQLEARRKLYERGKS